jgi:hypothetical protein
MPFQQRTGTDLRGEHFNENLIRSLKEASTYWKTTSN